MQFRRRLQIIISVIILGMSVASDVMAVVGRPLTPVSVAGVARRDARR